MSVILHISLYLNFCLLCLSLSTTVFDSTMYFRDARSESAETLDSDDDDDVTEGDIITELENGKSRTDYQMR